MVNRLSRVRVAGCLSLLLLASEPGSTQIASGGETPTRICEGGRCYLSLHIEEDESVCISMQLPTTSSGTLEKKWISGVGVYLASRLNDESCGSAQYFYVNDKEIDDITLAINAVHKALRSDSKLLLTQGLSSKTVACLLNDRQVRVSKGVSYAEETPSYAVVTLDGCDYQVEAAIELKNLGQFGSVKLTYKLPIVHLD